MADNVAINDRTGTAVTIASDDVGGVEWQRVKIGVGDDGSAQDVSANNPMPVRQASQTVDTAGFSAVGSSVLDTFFVQTPVVGTGVTYNQGAGSLNVLSGTTANAEFLARSVTAYRGSMRMRFTTVLSQRIANNNFAVILGDLIGAGVACSCISATQVNVTLTAHGWTSQMVGQFVFLGGIAGVAGVPGRYAVASIVDANTVQFTVSGWPASGTGTLTVFGRNHHKVLFNGVTATAAAADSQRNGWATGDSTLTINTTASPGTLIQAEVTGREVFFSDSLRASSVSPTFVTRASRYENIPDPNIDMYVFLWAYNGTSAPASTTTWTLGHVSIESFSNTPLYIQGFRSLGQQNSLPVTLTATNNIATVTGVTTVSTVSSMTSGNLGIPGIIADVASAALTTTTTTAAFTPTFGPSYQVNIPVTAVSGTTPTLDVVVQESDDTGTNWFDVYHFPRITATGMYRSPVMTLTGNRVRYVQTVGGTTPSFTRAINRLQASAAAPIVRSLIDRTIAPNTLNSASAALTTDGCSTMTLLVVSGAGATVSPIYGVQVSDDGASWADTGVSLTVPASSTLAAAVTGMLGRFARVYIKTAGTGATQTYATLRAVG